MEMDKIDYNNIKEAECLMLAPVFEFMKKKKWLQPYNAPKFRVAYNAVYPREYAKKIKNMGKRAKKKTMFILYRKYYRYFIEGKHLSKWLNKCEMQNITLNEENKGGNAVMRGIVRWFSSKIGYGYIKCDDGEEIFVHYSGINMEGFKALAQGQTVTFDVIDTEKGKQATNVTVIHE